MPKCPTCGTRLNVIKIERILTARQCMVRDAIGPVKRNTQRPGARSEDLYAYLCAHVEGWHWSHRTVQSELHILNHMEIIWHPGNRNDGWDIKPDDIVLVPAQVAA